LAHKINNPRGNRVAKPSVTTRRGAGVATFWFQRGSEELRRDIQQAAAIAYHSNLAVQTVEVPLTAQALSSNANGEDLRDESVAVSASRDFKNSSSLARGGLARRSGGETDRKTSQSHLRILLAALPQHKSIRSPRSVASHRLVLAWSA
jgi:hypothetical protein